MAVSQSFNMIQSNSWGLLSLRQCIFGRRPVALFGAWGIYKSGLEQFSSLVYVRVGTHPTLNSTGLYLLVASLGFFCLNLIRLWYKISCVILGGSLIHCLTLFQAGRVAFLHALKFQSILLLLGHRYWFETSVTTDRHIILSSSIIISYCKINSEYSELHFCFITWRFL